MKRFIIASFLIATLPISSWADAGHQKNQIIRGLSSGMPRSQESFDRDVFAIRSELEKSSKLDQEKLDMLSDWAGRLLAGQKLIKERVEKLRNDPDTAVQRREQAVQLAKLYKERVESLEQLLIDISNY